MIILSDINEAAERLLGHVHTTPILTSKYFNLLSGAELFFKCENFQKTGSFKARGALNSVLNLNATQRKNGVTTHSSGNHGQALAWAAAQQNVKAYIVMPKNSPQVKVDAVKGYGAQIIFCENTLQAREDSLAQVMENTKATFCPPYNYKPTIEGQATCAYEIFEDINELEFLLTPVGGGGLLAGSALSAHYFSPNTQVIGCEPELAKDAFLSFKTGTLQPPLPPVTIADGLRTSLGPINFGYIQNHVSDILLCSEEEIKNTQRLIWQRMKIIVEPSSAVPLACVLKNPKPFVGKKVGIVLSGGNVDI